jgi:hypothetical protein
VLKTSRWSPEGAKNSSTIELQTEFRPATPFLAGNCWRRSTSRTNRVSLDAKGLGDDPPRREFAFWLRLGMVPFERGKTCRFT